MADYRNYSADRSQKLCRGCAQMLPVELFHIKRTNPKKGPFRNNICRPCEQERVRLYRGTTKLGIAAEVVRRTKNICKTEGLPFDLTREAVKAMLDSQHWCCALTGIPFTIDTDPVRRGIRRGFQWDSISCDRIDHKGGYTAANIRFVLNAINLFRNDGPDERMYMLAGALLRHRKNPRLGFVTPPLPFAR